MGGILTRRTSSVTGGGGTDDGLPDPSYATPMRWTIQGIDTTTGQPRTMTIEAADRAEAEARAATNGLNVSRVESANVAAAAPALSYGRPPAAPGALARLTGAVDHLLDYAAQRDAEKAVKTPAPNGPTFRCPNPNCTYEGAAVVIERGSVGLGVLLLLLGLVPGIVYLALCVGRDYKCPRCGLKVSL